MEDTTAQRIDESFWRYKREKNVQRAEMLLKDMVRQNGDIERRMR